MINTLRSITIAVCGACLTTGMLLQTVTTATALPRSASSSLSSLTLRATDIPSSLGRFRQELSVAMPASQLLKTSGLAANAAAHGYWRGLATVFVRAAVGSSGVAVIAVGIGSFASSSGARWLMTIERTGKIEKSKPRAVSVGDEGLSFADGAHAEAVFRQGSYVGEIGLEYAGKAPLVVLVQLARILDARLAHA